MSRTRLPCDQNATGVDILYVLSKNNKAKRNVKENVDRPIEINHEMLFFLLHF